MKITTVRNINKLYYDFKPIAEALIFSVLYAFTGLIGFTSLLGLIISIIK